MSNDINFLIEDDYIFLFKEDFKNIFNVFKKHYPEHNNSYVDVMITNNKKIKKISKISRGINKETDILSFPFDGFINFNDDVSMPLGEIILSYEKIQMQANELNHSLRREFCFLFTHGLIHLLGYDHKANVEEEKEFNKKVYNIINELSIKRS
ncbi:MAG: rRNA maturation RNase YbeY [Metamycoplasmataceae bacterium]